MPWQSPTAWAGCLAPLLHEPPRPSLGVLLNPRSWQAQAVGCVLFTVGRQSTSFPVFGLTSAGFFCFMAVVPSICVQGGDFPIAVVTFYKVNSSFVFHIMVAADGEILASCILTASCRRLKLKVFLNRQADLSSFSCFRMVCASVHCRSQSGTSRTLVVVHRFCLCAASLTDLAN